jgi:hypothetical protein
MDNLSAAWLYPIIIIAGVFDLSERRSSVAAIAIGLLRCAAEWV